MADFAPEMELVKLASRNVEQFHEVAEAIGAKLKADPQDAESFIRPCAKLLQRLLEAQAAVEALLQKLYAADLLELAAGRR